jgi:hypothetical protein
MRIHDDFSREDEEIVRSFMAELAALSPRSRMLSPDVIWWKAQLRSRLETERHVTRALDASEPIGIAGVLALAWLLIMWVLPR